MIVRHATDPLNSEYTLCGDAFDLGAIPGDDSPTFAAAGETVNCPKCRVVINYVRKSFSRYRVLDRREQ